MKLKNIKFDEGALSGITLNMNPDYVPYIFNGGNTDNQMMDDIKNSKPISKTIFDVGAFIGSSSLIFSKYVGEKGCVVAFEPNPYNAKKIKKNLSLNPNYSKNIKLFECALAEEEGEMPMTLSADVDNGPSSTSRLNTSHSTIRNENLPKSFKEFLVDVETLDLFVKRENLIPDIIKVDIEGAEHNFLLGARNVIKKYKPLLYIEIHSEFCALKCAEILLSLQYTMTVINEEEDNRVMIRAEYTPSIKTFSIEEREKIAQRSIETSIGIMQLIEKMSYQLRNQFEEEFLNLIASLRENLDNKELEVNRLKEEILILNNKIIQMENSKSWKITSPLRLIFKKIRNEKK